jgi:hypothetical protein
VFANYVYVPAPDSWIHSLGESGVTRDGHPHLQYSKTYTSKDQLILIPLSLPQ